MGASTPDEVWSGDTGGEAAGALEPAVAPIGRIPHDGRQCLLSFLKAR